jgi:choline dehydrogenase-like flavoprotein
VKAVGEDGQPLEVRARQVVLACGAIENARLLLLADLDKQNGLAWLGRGFMEHPRDYSLQLVPEDPKLFANAGFYGFQTAKDGTPAVGRIALTEDALKTFGLPNASLIISPRPRSGTMRGMRFRMVQAIHRLVGITWRGGHAWSASQLKAEQFEVFNVVLHLEQRPSPANRVELGEKKDRYGNRLPRLHLAWTEAEQLELEKLRQLIGEWLRDAHVGHLEFTAGHLPDLNAHHHAGTTRMGASPTTGVVDANGRVFGVDNLYVAGASVFPTAGFANPVLTIVAMALRLSKHLAKA